MQLIAFAILALLSFSYAENLVAINSVDGRDVMSGIFYANAKGLPVRFMPVPGGNPDVFAAKVGSKNSVLLIQSTTVPVSGFVEADLKSRNNQMEIYPSSDGAATNLDLAVRSGVSSFIIVDSAYSDSAVSVMPYAQLTHSYVILADSTNIGKIKGIVAGKKITIYGYVDPAVEAGLAAYNPAHIGNGSDKYDDNIVLVRKTMDEFSLTRPILTDGSMLEDSIASSGTPLLLTGNLVPQDTFDFVEKSVREGKMTGLLLIGNDLIYPAYDMRERIKNDFASQGINATLSVMVKFAQAIPTEQSGVMALDTFTIPAYKPKLDITEISYNEVTKKLMVGLENTGEGALYYTPEVRVMVDGKEYRVFGATQVTLVGRGESSGLQYSLDLSGIDQGAVTASVLVKYGSYSKSLEDFLSSEGNLTTITYNDDSNVTVRGASYDKDKQVLSVSIKNNGASTAYAFTKLALVDETGAQVNVSAAAIREIAPSSIYTEEFPLIMSDKEIELNKEVTVAVEYGGRRGFLVKQATYVVSMGGAAASQMELNPLLLGAGAAIVLLLVLFAIYKFATRGSGKHGAAAPAGVKPKKEGKGRAGKSAKAGKSRKKKRGKK